MIRNINKSKGITLISMILTIIVLLIIIGTISYSSRNSLQKKKLDNFFNDIDALSDAVSVYYIKNGTLPVYYSEYDINGNNGEYREICIDNTTKRNGMPYLNIPEVGYDDLTSYYILDISKLENISLNNSNNVPEGIDTGEFFNPNPKDKDVKSLEKSIDEGIFVVNSLSHVVYYTNGIKVDGNTYYTKSIDYNKIPKFSKVDEKSVEEEIIKAGENANQLKEDKLRIVFWANGGTNAPEEIIVSKSHGGEDDDSLAYTLTNGTVGVGEPLNLGMKFLGWNIEENMGGDIVQYQYKKIENPNHILKVYNVANGFQDIKFSEYPGSVINLYAVWKRDESKVLYCYYPDGTGGIKPNIKDNSIERVGQAEAVSNYICIDIPSSGYSINWTWDSSRMDVSQEARYVGNSTTTVISENKYETTEPGTIQLKGSFRSLQVLVNNEKTNIKLADGGKDINFYKAYTASNQEQKSKTGGRAEVTSGVYAVWWTGKDGKFTVPSNPKTYSALGIVDPTRSLDYVTGKKSNGNESEFYLKSAILTDSDNLENVAYKNKTKELGSIVDISEEDDKQYCLYPRFGAKNYKIVDDKNHQYYHESLQEAYDQSCKLQKSGKNYNTIVLLRNVYSFSNSQIDENLYVKNYDPTYAKTVDFSSNNISLDFANYTMTRQGVINVSNNVQLTTKSSNMGINQSYGLLFKGTTNNEGIKLNNNSKLYLFGGISLKSENGVVIGLYDSSKFYGIYGLVENTNINKQNAIKSTSNTTNICLGISKDEISEINNSISVSDNNITIKTKKGVAINTEGNIYWKAGILKTEDIANKQGYNDNARIIVKTGSKLGPCIAYDTVNLETKIKLGKKDWEWKDEDSGSSKTYYSENLQNANNSLNLRKLPNLYTIKWINPVANSGDYNEAVINKKMKIDFNCFASDTPKFNNSSLTIMSKDVEIENLYCETTKGIYIGDIDNRDVSLKMKNCFIGANKTGISAITNYGKITYEASKLKRSGFYTKSTGHAIYNYGDITYDIGTSDKDIIYTEGSGKAIFNNGTSKNSKAYFKYIGNVSPRNMIYSSENSTADYVVYNGSNGNIQYDPGSNGILEAKNTSTKTICKALDNAGEFMGSSGTIKSVSTSATNNYTVYNTNLFKLYNTAKIQSNYIGIYNYGSSSISCIYDTAKIEAKSYGINTNNGKIYVASKITINNDKSVVLSNDSNSSGPEISGLNKYGIYVSGKTGMLTLGANESPVSVSKVSPVIKSDVCGVGLGSNTKFYFYDGVIKGIQNSISGNITSTPENYAVGKKEEKINGKTYKLAVLGPSKPEITAKLNNSSGSSYESGTWTNQDIYISLKSSKTGAGIKEYQWYENGKWVTRELTTNNNKGTITYKANRNQSIRFRAIDNDGVISEESTITIKINKT